MSDPLDDIIRDSLVTDPPDYGHGEVPPPLTVKALNEAIRKIGERGLAPLHQPVAVSREMDERIRRALGKSQDEALYAEDLSEYVWKTRHED